MHIGTRLSPSILFFFVGVRGESGNKATFIVHNICTDLPFFA